MALPLPAGIPGNRDQLTPSLQINAPAQGAGSGVYGASVYGTSAPTSGAVTSAAGKVAQTTVFGAPPILQVTYAAVAYQSDAVAVTIPFTVGNAVAAGLQARIGANLTIPFTTGNAVANGKQATVGANLQLAFTVGNAVANGSTAQIGANVRLAMLVGNAVASGSTATVEQFQIRITFAAAAYQSAPLTFSVGNAVASGPVGAEVIVDQLIDFAPGNAIASGPVGALCTVDQIIDFAVGNAVGCGYRVGGLYWRPAFSTPGAWQQKAANSRSWKVVTRAHC